MKPQNEWQWNTWDNLKKHQWMAMRHLGWSGVMPWCGCETPGMKQCHSSEWQWDTWIDADTPQWAAVRNQKKYKLTVFFLVAMGQLLQCNVTEWATEQSGMTPSKFGELQWNTWGDTKPPWLLAVRHWKWQKATPVIGSGTLGMKCSHLCEQPGHLKGC